MTPGKFITLEGGEGAGKSTQALRLGEFLRAQGYEVVVTREVGGCPPAEAIRKLWLSQDEGYWDPLAELLLIFAARREHLVKTIWPALARGAWVVCDRFMDSTRAYQAKAGPIEKMYRAIAGDFVPDLTLLLDVPVEVSMERVRQRGGWNDRYQLKEEAFHKDLRKKYLALAKKYAQRIQTVDVGCGLEAASANVQAAVQQRFQLK